MLDKLSKSLKDGMKNFIDSVFVDESTLNELVKDIQKALLKADVNVDLVHSLAQGIKERAKEEIGKKKASKEKIVKIVYEEIVEILGEGGKSLEIDEKPFKLLLVGLFGSGKTTSCGKIAKYFKKRGHSVCMISLDTYRPAAFKQLKQLGSKIDVPVFGEEDAKDPTKVIRKYEDEFEDYDVVIADSAGRDALEDDMIREIKGIDEQLDPSETLLTIPADLGQNAKNQTLAFQDALNITGVLITKVDGTAKAGGALTACSITDTNVKFIGTGEKISDLELFEPKRFVSRILGMGDLESLLEKAKEVEEKEIVQEDMKERIMSGKFNLKDFKQQIQALNEMGSLKKIMNMIPGMGMTNLPKDALDIQEENMEVFDYIMDSMTEEELEDPSIVSKSRIERIANGSGRSIEEVRKLLSQYKKIKKFVKKMKGKNFQKMTKKMQKKGLPDNVNLNQLK